MMLSSDKSILGLFCAHEEHGDDSDNEDDDVEDDGQDRNSDDETAVGSKRKATSGRPRRRPPKKAKAAGTGKPRKYFLRLKSRDTSTGEIHLIAEKGTIKFNRPDLSSFTREANMCSISRGIIFTARKISAIPLDL